MDCPCSNFYQLVWNRYFMQRIWIVSLCWNRMVTLCFYKAWSARKSGDEENLKKNHYEKRNRGICEKHQNGSRVSELAEEYALSEKSIQRILRCTAADGKKYGLNTKTERQPWKNPRAVFCISVAFFPFFLAFSERCCYNKRK